jgi:ribosomal protein S18 acetylase RimI-like enzyme
MGLVAVGPWLLADKVASSEGLAATIFAWLSRIATFVFFVYYTALDSIGGIGLSKSIEITEQLAHEGRLTPEQVLRVEQVLNQTWTNAWVGGVGSFISLTGSWAVFASALFVAIALFLSKKAPWPALILLVAFGWELQVRHTMAFVCAYSGTRLIGFLNLAWEGGEHAFVLDTLVHPAFRRRGIGRELVRRAVAEAEAHEVRWVHVDFEPYLQGFYDGCGFRSTAAGLIRLR